MSSFHTWQVGGSPGAVQERLDVCFYSSDERSVEGPVCCQNSLSWPVLLHTLFVVEGKTTVIGNKEIMKFTLHRETGGRQS